MIMAKDNMSFLVCCANGAGSSLMMKMTMEKVLKKLGIKPSKVHHCALSEGKTAANQFDVVFCAQNFANMFKDAEKKGTTVIGLRNIMSAQEMEDKMREHGII
jgi:PTS system ascorbate-specific IIB component